MIDYGQWRHALAMTESGDNPRQWGDQGLAVGRFQMHPVFAKRWIPAAFIAGIDDHTSWDDVFEACLRHFFGELAQQAPDVGTLAGWFHEHGGPGPITDHGYIERFMRWYGSAT